MAPGADPGGVLVCSAAFCATEGGSDGPRSKDAARAAGIGRPRGPRVGGAACTAGVMVLVWPPGLVTLMVLVTLLMTTVLWT
ncbi:MAG TPA: hypothetical protein VE087_08325, partial [Xanthobacteraceae bacterium]|nr:hypothetical protein [Xanthobacteraceae bacterium]